MSRIVSSILGWVFNLNENTYTILKTEPKREKNKTMKT
jgi:hypothetical protein